MGAFRGNAAELEVKRAANRERNKRWREKHRERKRAQQRAWWSRNKEQVREGLQAWRKANPEKYRAQQRRAFLKNPEKKRERNRIFMREWNRKHGASPEAKARRWARHLKRNYGITPVRLEAMKEAQDHRCLICHQRRKLSVDHDHATGRVRGLLCNACNCGIGHFSDDPRLLTAAIEYLTVPLREVASGNG